MFLHKYIRIRPQNATQRVRQCREVQKLNTDIERLGYMIAALPDYKQHVTGFYPMLAGVVCGPLFADALEAYKFAVSHKVSLIDQFTEHIKNTPQT